MHMVMAARFKLFNLVQPISHRVRTSATISKFLTLTDEVKMTNLLGTRVLRGPDWASGEADGGEGHLGTVVSLLDRHKVCVLWDNGQESVLRSGAEGKYDLRIFDSAPVGVRHPDTTCCACEERPIYGMLWRCKICKSCELCPLCYVADKHDIQHEFLRYDQPGSSGEPVKKRAASLKVRALGIFPGAKVTRGKHWVWADQDGGTGSVGEVMGFENVAPDSSRNIVRVQWPGSKGNSYRLGFQGNVDLKCVEEEAGTYYYREHLPVFSTTRQSSAASASTFSSDSSTVDTAHELPGRQNSPNTSVDDNTSHAEVLEASVSVGDKVVIQVEENKLKELQTKYGGTTATMIKCIGKTGEVTSFSPNGAISVKFDKIAFRFSPKAIIKVPALSVRDIVRIHPDEGKVKFLNKRVGWKSDMEMALGKVGQVTKMDSDGDVVVSFGRAAFMFSPACCLPISVDTSIDSLASSSDDSSSSSLSNDSNAASSNDNDDYMELHQDLMRFIAQLAGLDVVGGGRRVQSPISSIERLLKAIARDDIQTVRTLCQQNRSLVNSVYKGLTPVILASHEGQKDICSCLLAQGADINARGEKGNTPLMAAIEGKQEETALFLLEKGANPIVQNSRGRNPVHLAAFCNMSEVVRVLVQKGADANAKDQYGNTPLHDAIEKDNAEAMDMLLRVKNINLQAQNRKGYNLLQYACLKGNAYATERILSRDTGQVDKLMEGRFSALHIAADNDHVDCIKLLVNNGNAEVNLEGHKKLTPLHLACLKGHCQSMEVLLELGSSVNVQDADGDTPLHVTLGLGLTGLLGQFDIKTRIRMACILLSKGAYCDMCNKMGKEPLECCSHPAMRQALHQFIQQNPHVIKRTGGSTGRAVGTGLDTLLRGMTLPCGAAGCSRMSDITLLPCGHKTLCRVCCLRLSQCPLCHQTIERRLHKRSDSQDSDLMDACRPM